MSVLAVKLLGTDDGERLYLAQVVYVKYPFLGWLPDPSASALRAVFCIVAVSGLLVAAGLLYRLAAGVLFVSWGYLFFCDQSPYQNHDYLSVLLAFLFILMPLNGVFSIDARIWPRFRSSTVPAWCLFLLRFQVAVVYVFGGVRKLNPDWLRGEPIRTMLHSEAFEHAIVGQWFLSEAVVMSFAYGGLLLDLLIIPALLWRPTRLAAFVVSCLFHLMNAWLWDIDIFPWFMVPATLLFFPPDYPRRMIAWIRRRPNPASQPILVSPKTRLSRRETAIAALLAGYAAIQLLLPCRPFLYPGHPLEQPQLLKFSWNMMLRLDSTGLRFVVVDNVAGETWKVEPESVLSPFQMGRMGEPDVVHQAALYVARMERDRGSKGVSVYVQTRQSVHGRRWQAAYDPQVDFAALPRTTGVRPWVLPFEEPYPPDPKPRSDYQRARWQFCKEQGWLPLPRHAGDREIERRLSEWSRAYLDALEESATASE